MAVPPLWMFVIGAAAVVGVAAIGIMMYEGYRAREKQNVKTKPLRIKRRNGKPCTICYNEANVTFLPCGHTIMCRPCVKLFFEKGNERCPDVYCRARIEDLEMD